MLQWRNNLMLCLYKNIIILMILSIVWKQGLYLLIKPPHFQEICPFADEKSLTFPMWLVSQSLSVIKKYPDLSVFDKTFLWIYLSSSLPPFHDNYISLITLKSQMAQQLISICHEDQVVNNVSSEKMFFFRDERSKLPSSYSCFQPD